MSDAGLPLRFWNCAAVLSVAADDTDRAIKAIERRTADIGNLLARHGISAAALADRIGTSQAGVERLLTRPIPPPAVILDAEDAIAPGPGRTAAALAAAADRLQDRTWSPGTLRFVRLPAADPKAARAVLDASPGSLPDAFVLPKAEDAVSVESVADAVRGRGGVRLVLMIETPRGVQATSELTAGAGDSLAGLVFGAVDYAAASGVRDLDEEHPLVAWARLVVANAAAAAGVPSVDGMTLAFPVAPASGTAEEVRDVVMERIALAYGRAGAAAALGMSGKLVGHPGQLLAVMLAFQDAFSDPAVGGWEEEVRAYADATEHGAGVAMRAGSMIDGATDRQYRLLLRRAAAIGRWDPERAAQLNVITTDEAAGLARQWSVQ
jgi:citrate lyase beta subunit